MSSYADKPPPQQPQAQDPPSSSFNAPGPNTDPSQSQSQFQTPRTPSRSRSRSRRRGRGGKQTPPPPSTMAPITEDPQRQYNSPDSSVVSLSDPSTPPPKALPRQKTYPKPQHTAPNAPLAYNYAQHAEYQQFQAWLKSQSQPQQRSSLLPPQPTAEHPVQVPVRVVNPETPRPSQGGNNSGGNNLRLRLDLNLDVEVTLKATIHGDLTLALLLVLPSFFPRA